MALLGDRQSKNRPERKGTGLLKGIEQESRELTINEITTLDQATAFIRKRDKEFTQSTFLLAHALKKVHEEKLYEEKYNTFQEYYESELNYGKRHIYNLLKIAETFPIETQNEIINLGVRKLLPLTGLDDEQRQEYIESNNLSDKSSDEIKNDIKSILGKDRPVEIIDVDTITEVKNIPDSKSEGNDDSGEDKTNNIDNVATLEDNTILQNNFNISISRDELTAVKRFYSKLDSLYTSVEKFKDEQQNDNPLQKDKLIEMLKLVEEAERELDKYKKLINKYLP